MKTIKGYYKKPEGATQNTTRDLSNSMFLFNDFQNTKQSVAETVDKKLEEIDTRLEDVEKTVDSKLQEVDKKVGAVVDFLGNIKVNGIKVRDGKPGPQGPQGLPADENKVLNYVLSRIPKYEPQTIDEEALLSKFLSKVRKTPSNNPSLKVLQQKIEADPMAIIDKILELPESKLSKLKLKSSNIDGLDQTISAFRNQLARKGGYLHGGGDTVVAGSGITITKNTNGTKTISSTGGGGAITVYNDVLTGTINGVNTVFTVPNAIGGAIALVIGNSTYQNGVDYTFSGSTVTMTTAPDISLAAEPKWMAYSAVSSTVYNDAVSGTINSSNTVFTVANTISQPIILALGNSVYQSGVDYTATGTTITMTVAPDISLSGQPFWFSHL